VRRPGFFLLPLIGLAVFFFFWKAGHNPPGYYIDEASISFNAYTIAQTGQDEFGTPWPLYFRAFGDYKNPVYIYLLAGLYRLTGPSIMVARLFSVTLGLLAAGAFGMLAWRVTGRRMMALITTLVVLFTPWHFEISRMVLEVALYPLVLALLLLFLHRAASRSRWNAGDILGTAALLGLVTYTYSIGRLLGPLLALGLILFATPPRRVAIGLSWIAYLITLVPIFLFNRAHPGALSERFRIITYLDSTAPLTDSALAFAAQLIGNLNPRRLLVTGDPNPEQIAHIDGTPLLSLVVGFLVVAGLIVIFRQRRSDPWWRFVVYGSIAALVPASLTNEPAHMLRLSPLMVFLFVLAIPGIEYLWAESGKRRLWLGIAILLVLAQGAVFGAQFNAGMHSNRRLRQFDHGYPDQVFARAVAMPNRPIYLADALWIPGYIQAYWNAVLRHFPIDQLVRLGPDEPPPEGALVISTEENCPRCDVVATNEFYTLYLARGPLIERKPLPRDGFIASIVLRAAPPVFRRQEQASLNVIVRNESNQSWAARERGGGPYQVSLGNHWLDENGKMLINDDGRAALLKTMAPGASLDLQLVVNAPRTPGNYILELDMLQEGVSWFGLQGSPTVKLPVQVK
jgi:4-amino-4-deoxy-L-arabinose transferase-like glycosyltransferase